ncbi:MAG: aspartate/glutamate racemase family protein [Ignavibacteriales bacterium]
MTRILVINPVGTSRWDVSDYDYLQRYVRASTHVKVVSLPSGPPSLESLSSVAAAEPAILDTVRKYRGQCDAIVLNCFADPGMRAAREVSPVPVLGAAETSMTLACMLGERFSVICLSRQHSFKVRHQARVLGVSEKLASCRWVDLAPLELDSDPERFHEILFEQATACVEVDGAEVVVLGCTGMAYAAGRLADRVAFPVIDPMAATVKMAELIAGLHLSTSRKGLYSFNRLTGKEGACL